MKFKSSVFVLSTLILAAPGLTQYLYKSFQLQQEQPEMRLASNSITDIVIAGETVWFGTGNGLSKTGNAGLDFLSYKHEQGIGRGGVSALAVSADVIWVATGFDSLTVLGSQQTGGGLAYSMDNGDTWQFVEQPGVTPVQNITFDIALRNGEVWITSFGGGLRKSDDLGQEWKIIPPDSFIFDPFARLNHRAFSVLNADGVLWVGTAGGINRSLDGGETWTNFSHQNQANPVTGNFVVTIANQKFRDKNIIWAGTRETTVESGDTTEFRGISWSEDLGFSWKTALRGQTVHNIAFSDSAVFAASDIGLFLSIDFGESWLMFPKIENPTGTREILSNEVFDVAATDDHVLWVGTADGLAKTPNYGVTWEVFQVFSPTGQNGERRTYAYPNPFSPSLHNQLYGEGFVRFQYNTKGDTEVTLKIYDFAMEHVVTVVQNKARPGAGDFYEIWNGLDKSGREVHNGVYFYQLKLTGDGTFWGKLIVMN